MSRDNWYIQEWYNNMEVGEDFLSKKIKFENI